MTPVYLPVQAINRSQRVRIGTGATAVDLKPGVTSYVDITDGGVKRDLQRHSAIGAILIVGGLTSSNATLVVTAGGVVTAGTGLSVNVAAGELEDRSIGSYVLGVAGTNVALTAAHATKDRVDLVWWDALTGAVGKTDGALFTAGTAVAPATPAGKVPLATVAVAHTATVPGTITDVRPRAAPIDPSGNVHVTGTLGVDGATTVAGLTASSVTVTGEVGAAAIESEGGIGFFGTEPPVSAASITGALSTVADAPAKAVLTSIIAALVASGQATSGTT